jgi:hypothetical protein
VVRGHVAGKKEQREISKQERMRAKPEAMRKKYSQHTQKNA